MIPQTFEELKKVEEECRKMATERALISALGGTIPLPGSDIAIDIAILLEVLPTINRKFGLSKEQIDGYDEKIKIMIYEAIKKVGAELVGKVITKELIIAVLKRLGIRITAKQATKYVPIIGQALSGIISFGAMKFVINYHIDKCVAVVTEIIKEKEKNSRV